MIDALNGLLDGLLDIQAITDLIDQITGLLGGSMSATQVRSV